MKVTFTAQRYLVLDALLQHGGWMDAVAISQVGGFSDPMKTYGVVDRLVSMGLVSVMKRRVDNRATRVKLVSCWRITELGASVLDEYNAGRKKGSTVTTTPEPKPEYFDSTPQTAPEPAPEQQKIAVEMRMAAPLDTIMAMEEEIKRLRQQVAKYADVVVNIPNVGDVHMTKDEVRGLLQQLLEMAREGE